MQKLVKIRSLKSTTDWSSPGVLLKPEHCRLCGLAAVGKAFTPDYVPENPKIAYILGTPTQSDAIERKPFSGSSGYHWEKLFITELGLKKYDVLISHVVRCVQPVNTFGNREYPTGYLARQGELNCRFYDTGLNTFDPNVFIITFDPSTIYGVGCHQRQIQRDVSKGLRFIKLGYRPAILFGDGPASLFYPWLNGNGGIKNWASHWWKGSLPFKNKEITEKELNRKLFVEG